MAPHPPLVSRLEEAVDYAQAQGLLKLTKTDFLEHAPFSLFPSPLSAQALQDLVSLSAPFHKLYHRVASDMGFIKETLEKAAREDAFLAELLALAEDAQGKQDIRFWITRNDFFSEKPHQFRQVEMNTIAAGYAGLSGQVFNLHRHLLSTSGFADDPSDGLVENHPLEALTEGVVQAHQAYGHPDGAFLMIVQEEELNRIDQRLFEFKIREKGIEVLRATLEELGENGRLQEGHLYLGNRKVTMAYFRAGYGPEDHKSPLSKKGRAAVHNSSVISIPDLPGQLSGAKKIQQELTKPGRLKAFGLSDEEAAVVEATFVRQYAPEDSVAEQGSVLAWEDALAHPNKYVLKPQREGGGHNLYDEELQKALNRLNSDERAAYILMERIQPKTHKTFLVRGGEAMEAEVVSEIGRFGVFLAKGDEILLNQDAGSLVRTKQKDVKEGGVSAGYGFLDSLYTGDFSAFFP